VEEKVEMKGNERFLHGNHKATILASLIPFSVSSQLLCDYKKNLAGEQMAKKNFAAL